MIGEQAGGPDRAARVGDLPFESGVDHLIDQYWKTEFVDRHVGATLRGLLSPEPDPAVVRLVHGRAQSLSRADVRASLGRLRASFDFPVVAAPPRHAPGVPVARPRATSPKPGDAPEPVDTPKPVGEGTPWRHVTLGQLIDAGLVRVPLELFHHYKGSDLRARIDGAARVVFDGTAYDSLSIAGGMGRLSVVGPTPGHPYPPTNGWTFWEFRATDGSQRQLDTIRRELHESKVVKLDGRRTG